jgi:hypothetical protein
VSQSRRSRSTPGRRQRGDVQNRTWTPEAIQALGAFTDLQTAAQIFGLAASTAYALARRGQFPVPVIRAGTQYRVPVQPILAALNPTPDQPP